ncbi:hypothetical protein [Streptosporangium sp. NPDC000396]
MADEDDHDDQREEYDMAVVLVTHDLGKRQETSAPALALHARSLGGDLGG